MHASLRVTCACGTVVPEDELHRHMRICPSHDLRRQYFWDTFPVVDEDTGALEKDPVYMRPFTHQEYYE